MGSYLPIIEKDVSWRIKQERILYIKQAMNHVEIGSDHMEPVCVRGKIDDFAVKLNLNFYRCHSYLIVNLERIDRMERGVILFDTGLKTTIGRNYFFPARKAYNKYLNSL